MQRVQRWAERMVPFTMILVFWMFGLNTRFLRGSAQRPSDRVLMADVVAEHLRLAAVVTLSHEVLLLFP
jgi:hypothetical protein